MHARRRRGPARPFLYPAYYCCAPRLQERARTQASERASERETEHARARKKQKNLMKLQHGENIPTPCAKATLTHGVAKLSHRSNSSVSATKYIHTHTHTSTTAYMSRHRARALLRASVRARARACDTRHMRLSAHRVRPSIDHSTHARTHASAHAGLAEGARAGAKYTCLTCGKGLAEGGWKGRSEKYERSQAGRGFVSTLMSVLLWCRPFCVETKALSKAATAVGHSA